MLGVLGIMTYGWRKLFVSQREKLELGREKMWSRIHITPLLQAEEDRDQVRRHYADKAREKEFLGSETSIMNSDRYVKLCSDRSMPSGSSPEKSWNLMLTELTCRFVRPTFSYAPAMTDK